jgi:hypothetical protein
MQPRYPHDSRRLIEALMAAEKSLDPVVSYASGEGRLFLSCDS